MLKVSGFEGTLVPITLLNLSTYPIILKQLLTGQYNGDTSLFFFLYVLQELKSSSRSEDQGYCVDSVSEASFCHAHGACNGSGDRPGVDDFDEDNAPANGRNFGGLVRSADGTKSPLSKTFRDTGDSARSKKAASISARLRMDADPTAEELPAFQKELMVRVTNLEQQLSDHQRKLDHRVEQFENRIAGVVASLRAEFETDLRPKCRAKTLHYAATVEDRLSTFERLVQTSGVDSSRPSKSKQFL